MGGEVLQHECKFSEPSYHLQIFKKLTALYLFISYRSITERTQKELKIFKVGFRSYDDSLRPKPNPNICFFQLVLSWERPCWSPFYWLGVLE